MSVLFFLGGLLPSALLLAASAIAHTKDIDPAEGVRIIEEQLKAAGKSPEVAHHLATQPPQLDLLLRGTFAFAPFLILLVGFDQIAGDIQHRAIRYIAGRSRRETIVIGKAVGLWGVLTALLLVLNLVVWILTLIQGWSPVINVLSWGPRVWIYSSFACAAWVGLISLISSFFKTPIVALFAGAPVFFGLWLTHLIVNHYLPDSPVRFAFPFRFEELLVSHKPLEVLAGAMGSFAWGAVMVALATIVVKKRDI